MINKMTIYNRNCNATRYLAIKDMERREKRKKINAHAWVFTCMGLYICLAIQIVRAVL